MHPTIWSETLTRLHVIASLCGDIFNTDLLEATGSVSMTNPSAVNIGFTTSAIGLDQRSSALVKTGIG